MCNSFIERNKNAINEFWMVQVKSYCLNCNRGICFVPLPTEEGGGKPVVFHLRTALRAKQIHILNLTTHTRLQTGLLVNFNLA